MTIKIEDVKVGDFLTPDDGFDCMREGVELEVQQDSDGELWISCSHGRHYLAGQEYVGFTKHRKSV